MRVCMRARARLRMCVCVRMLYYVALDIHTPTTIKMKEEKKNTSIPSFIIFFISLIFLSFAVFSIRLHLIRIRRREMNSDGDM